MLFGELGLFTPPPIFQRLEIGIMLMRHEDSYLTP
jgi:hypothetical protein